MNIAPSNREPAGTPPASRTAHLTEDQFAHYLAGSPLRRDAQVHLAACGECRAEIEAFSHSMDDFARAAMECSVRQEQAPHAARLALRRAEQLDRARDSGAPAHSAAGRRFFLPALEWAAITAALAVGIAVPVAHTHRAMYASHGSLGAAGAYAGSDPAQRAGGDSDLQIEQDNALLSSVNNALEGGEVSPFEEYDLTPPESPALYERAENRVRSRTP